MGNSFQISPLQVYKPTIKNYFLKMMVYGKPGVGKTTLAATAAAVPDMKDVLVINVEGGILSITDPELIGADTLPDVQDFNDFKQLDGIINFLRTQDHHYRTVIVDSLSELQKYNLDSIVGDKLGQKSKSGTARTSLDEIWQEDYGDSTQAMRRVVRKFRDLPMHVIFTCHDIESKDDENKETVCPALTPKLRTSVIGYLDVVGYLYTAVTRDADGKEAMTRRMLTQPYGRWTAKDRSPGGKLGSVIVDPTMAKIMEKITGGK